MKKPLKKFMEKRGETLYRSDRITCNTHLSPSAMVRLQYSRQEEGGGGGLYYSEYCVKLPPPKLYGNISENDLTRNLLWPGMG